MFNITDSVLVGNSRDEECAVEYLDGDFIDCVLVVAHDMTPTCGWADGIQYGHVGLVDGPGNRLAAYHAAVLALASLVARGTVMVCCHDGGRSLAVAIMYLYLTGEGPSWDEAVERVGNVAPAVNDAHREAFFLMDWGMLARVLDGEIS